MNSRLYPAHLYEVQVPPIQSFSKLQHALSRRSLDFQHFLTNLPPIKTNVNGADGTFYGLRERVASLDDALQGSSRIRNDPHRKPYNKFDLPSYHPPLPPPLHQAIRRGLEEMEIQAMGLSNDIEMNPLRLSRKDPRGCEPSLLALRRRSFEMAWVPWLQARIAETETWWLAERRKMGSRL